jgi:hypothetical protein
LTIISSKREEKRKMDSRPKTRIGLNSREIYPSDVTGRREESER